MPSRGMKDTTLELDRREQASKKVKIVFVEDSFTNFNVLNEDGTTKYLGKIDLEKNVDDQCTCDSFYYGMQFEKISEDSVKVESRYVNEHGTTYQCKHVLAAKALHKEDILC